MGPEAKESIQTTRRRQLENVLVASASLRAQSRLGQWSRSVFGKTIALALVTSLANLLMLGEARAQAVACSATEVQQTFSFPAGAWTAGTTGPYNFTVGTGATAVTLTFSSAATIAFDAGLPAQTTSGNVVNTVRHGHTNGGTNALLSTFNLALSRPLNKLRFVSTDVDFQTGSWQDQTVSRVNGSIFPTALTGGTRHTVALATGTVTATTSFNCPNTDATCNVTNDFNMTGITSAALEFRSGPNNANQQQFVGWNSFSWCLPLPTVNKAFTGPLNVGGTQTLTFTVTQPAGNPTQTFSFTDTLPAGLRVGTGAVGGTCSGGTVTATAGATTITVANRQIVNPATTCTITVPITTAPTPTLGNCPQANNTNGNGNLSALTNIVAQVTNSAAGGGTSTTGACVSVVPAPPTITKTSAATDLVAGGNTNLTVTIGNTNAAAITLSSVFTDTFPAGMTINTAGNTGTCTGVTATAGANNFTIANGASIPAGGCTVIVNVTSATAGARVNTIPAGALNTSAGSNAAPATSTTNFYSPPTVAKTIAPSAIQPGATAVLTLTLGNPAANPGSITGVAVNDTFPAGLTLANTTFTFTPAACGAVTKIAGGASATGDNNVRFTAATIAPNATCAVQMNVTSTTGGLVTNTTTAPTATGPVVTTGIAASAPLTVTSLVTGTVFNDVNGATNSLVDGTGTNAGSASLTAYLVDGTGNVVGSSPVAANGTYTIANVANGTYSVVLSNTAGVANGAAAPAPSLPAGWVNTGEGLTPAGEAAAQVNGSIANVTVANASVANANFGIEQPPVAGGAVAPVAVNPAGTVNVPVPATAFTTGSSDAAPGTIASYLITAFPTNATSITISGTAYTAATFPVGGVTVSAANIGTAVTVDPFDGGVTVAIPFRVVDNAGVPSANIGTASLPFSTKVDVAITKTTSSTFVVGSSASYTLTPNNLLGTTPTAGVVTVTDTLPQGLTYVATGSGGAGWSCAAAAQVVTCTSSAVIAAGASGTPITINVSIDSRAVPSVTNVASVAAANEAPAETGNNSALLTVTVTNAPVNTFLTDGAQSSTPGSSVFYPHTFNASLAGTVSFASTQAPNPNIPGWTTTIFRDTNCNGVLDGAEGAVPLTTATPVSAGDQVCIIVRNDIPAGAPINAQDVITTTATFTPPTGAPINYTRQDVTTVVLSGGLTLAKTVRNVTQGGTAATSNTAKPGDVLEYVITYNNRGNGPITTIVVTDVTPVFTTFVSAACTTPLPAAITACTVTSTPTVGASGTVTWTLGGALNAGQSGTVVFRVTVE